MGSVKPASFIARQLPRISDRASRGLRKGKNAAFILPSLNRVRGLTMAGIPSLLALGEHVLQVVDEKVPGDLVECGAWRGGASFLMADLLRRKGDTARTVWLFDSFEGLPPPEPIDGQRAAEYTEDVDSPTYFDNCSASVEEVSSSASRLGLGDRTKLVKGWFDQTLPANREQIGQIAILRLDSDWYSSVKTTLENLYDQVSPGGFVVIDDYYDWEGCAIAVHEFLSERKLPHRISSVLKGSGEGECAYFRK